VVLDNPTTWIYGSNIIPAFPGQVCIAISQNNGDTNDQDADTLGLEWTRVHKKIKVNNCIDDDKRQVCSNF
jgi:hypothetical protein